MSADLFHSSVGGVRYKCIGYGKTVLLMIPGAIGTIETDFSPIISDFDHQVFTIVAWDPPGYGNHGGNERYWGTGMLEMDAEIAMELMKFLGLQRYSLIGYSDGAMTALIMAAKYPAFIEKVVAVGGNAFVDGNDIEIYERSRDIDTWPAAAKQPYIDLYGPEKFRLLWHKWCDTMKEFYTHFSGDICSKFLSRITCPVAIIHGRNDTAVPVEHAVSLFEQIRTAELWIIPDCDHDVQIVCSTRFVGFVKNFL